MLKLGLTGNICAGKSEVEKILESKGYKVIDLDKVAHKFLENNKEIENHFKTLDRKKIAQIVVLDEFKKDYEKIVISGALLYEAEFDKLFDKIIYIDAPYEIRLKRLIKRNNLDEASALKRMNAQNDNKNKADIIINNSGTIEDLKKAIDLIL